MKILYLGDTSLASTSRHRADALGRLGHEPIMCDPYTDLGVRTQSRFEAAVHYRTGYRLLQSTALKWAAAVGRRVAGVDLVWVNSGELFGPKVLAELRRQLAVPIVLYNNDDPTGNRDGRHFDQLRHAFSCYDLCAVPSRMIPDSEYRDAGVRRLLRVPMSYDELAHRRFDDVCQIDPSFRSEVSFVGTWIPGEHRDEFLLQLLQRGIPVSVRGNRWERSPQWLRLRQVWRGPASAGRDYVAAIQGARVSLGLLSKGNRDGHTRRSVEIPFAGGLLCAERTSDHKRMFREGIEAVFWSDVDECAQVCRQLLADEPRRMRICLAGRQRMLALGFGNEAVCKQILEEVSDLQQGSARNAHDAHQSFQSRDLMQCLA
ncbi:MAG: glycosyltransferase family 1 protein [Burkholderiales bacterium]|nr:glycosyltransferase family 1 protein [Burkholderiales bacterium]